MPGQMSTLVFLSVILLACRPTESPHAPITEFNTVGDVVYVSNPVGYRPTLSWSAGEPILEIGSALGEGVQSFGSIGGVAIDEHRRIYVGDSQALQVRVFDRDGEYLFSFGRQGQGPGEFENIDAIRIGPAGEVLVRDVNQGRVSFFTAAGDFLRQIRLDRAYFQFAARPTLWASDDGRVFDWLRVGITPGMDSTGMAVYNASGALDTIIVTSVAQPKMIMVRRGNLPVASLPVPMTPVAATAVDRSGRIIAGFGDDYKIDVLDASGTLLRRMTREVKQVSTPPWLVDSVTARVDRLKEMAGGGDIDRYELPEHRPAFTSILVDDFDHWWVARDGDRVTLPTRYDIFDPDGRYLGELSLPAMKIMQIGPDFVAGVTQDDLDVERLIMLPLRRL